MLRRGCTRVVSGDQLIKVAHRFAHRLAQPRMAGIQLGVTVAQAGRSLLDPGQRGLDAVQRSLGRFANHFTLLAHLAAGSKYVDALSDANSLKAPNLTRRNASAKGPIRFDSAISRGWSLLA